MTEGKLTIEGLLAEAARMRGSDLHLTVGSPPRVRVAGELVALDAPLLDADMCRDLAYSSMTSRHRIHFEKGQAVDFSFGFDGISRFRGNVFTQSGTVAAVFRVIPHQVPSLRELGLPLVTRNLCEKRQGLILVTGPTGSGKSTTLAAMVDRINRRRRCHIVTVEDPVEFLHPNRQSIVNQREVRNDVESFSAALRTILRADPDVVLIGEMRDQETVEAALRIAETGHLTLGTLHTNSADATIHRVVDIFPPHQQSQVRGQLALVLEGILAQRLLPLSQGGQRVLATELLVPSPGIRNLIRDARDHQIYSMMQAGQNRACAHTMNQSLARLVASGTVLYEVAAAESQDIAELDSILELLAGRK